LATQRLILSGYVVANTSASWHTCITLAAIAVTPRTQQHFPETYTLLLLPAGC
jgi:hypothetical protein